MKKLIAILLFIITANTLFAQGRKDTLYVQGLLGGGGISQLGSPAFGLTRLNDSTYIVDSSIIKTNFQATQDSLALVAQMGGVSTAWEKAGNTLVLTAGNKIKITEGSDGSVGQTTLVSGTKAITITGVSTSTRAIVTFVSSGGTVTTTWQYAAVCTANTLTITAITNAGATNTSDTSVLNYFIIN